MGSIINEVPIKPDIELFGLMLDRRGSSLTTVQQRLAKANTIRKRINIQLFDRALPVLERTLGFYATAVAATVDGCEE